MTCASRRRAAAGMCGVGGPQCRTAVLVGEFKGELTTPYTQKGADGGGRLGRACARARACERALSLYSALGPRKVLARAPRCPCSAPRTRAMTKSDESSRGGHKGRREEGPVACACKKGAKVGSPRTNGGAQRGEFRFGGAAARCLMSVCAALKTSAACARAGRGSRLGGLSGQPTDGRQQKRGRGGGERKKDGKQKWLRQKRVVCVGWWAK